MTDVQELRQQEPSIMTGRAAAERACLPGMFLLPPVALPRSIDRQSLDSSPLGAA